MTSILTNSSAMVALQTLKSINNDMSKTQSEISTGKTVATAKDNAAVWSISKNMESDTSAIDSITSSLDLGESTVSVARDASETVLSKLQDMQKLIVSAQSENVDRDTLQSQLDMYSEDINTTINSAQFNGLNLLTGTTGMSVLASISRSGSGALTTSTISVDSKNLLQGTYTAKTVFGADTTGVSGSSDNFATTLDAATGTSTLVIDDSQLAAGDSISLSLGGKSVSYTLTDQDLQSGSSTADIVAVGLKNAIDSLGISGLTVDYDSGSPGQLTLTNGGTSAMTVTGQYEDNSTFDLSSLDVTNDAGAASALTNISALIDNVTAAAAYYGAKETQLSDQSDFMSNLSDTMTTGVGSLVDADMEEASARLTALQTQQQLGIQALSIANQQPQSILTLFQ